MRKKTAWQQLSMSDRSKYLSLLQQGYTLDAIKDAYNFFAEGGHLFEGGGYTVQAGDVLSKIAQKHGTTVEDIVALNKGLNPDKIAVGQVLKMPSATTSTTAPNKSNQSLVRKVDFNAYMADKVNGGNRNRPMNIPAMEQLQDSLIARSYNEPQRLAILATAAQEMGSAGAASKGVGGNGYLGLSKERMPISYLSDTPEGRGKQIHYVLTDLNNVYTGTHPQAGNWNDGGSGGPKIISGKDGFNQFWNAGTPKEATQILNKSYIRPAGGLDSWNNRASVAEGMQKHMKANGGYLDNLVGKPFSHYPIPVVRYDDGGIKSTITPVKQDNTTVNTINKVSPVERQWLDVDLKSKHFENLSEEGKNLAVRTLLAEKDTPLQNVYPEFDLISLGRSFATTPFSIGTQKASQFRDWDNMVRVVSKEAIKDAEKTGIIRGPEAAGVIQPVVTPKTNSGVHLINLRRRSFEFPYFSQNAPAINPTKGEVIITGGKNITWTPLAHKQRTLINPKTFTRTQLAEYSPNTFATPFINGQINTAPISDFIYYDINALGRTIPRQFGQSFISANRELATPILNYIPTLSISEGLKHQCFGGNLK